MEAVDKREETGVSGAGASSLLTGEIFCAIVDGFLW